MAEGAEGVQSDLAPLAAFAAPQLVRAVEAGKVSVSAAVMIAKQDEDTLKRICRIMAGLGTEK